MDNTWIAILVALILTVPYLLLPLALLDPKNHRSTGIFRCPEGGGLAEVEIKTSGTDLSSRKPLLQIRDCSLWTQRNGCNQTCLKIAKR
jgi:hypothetical protein